MYYERLIYDILKEEEFKAKSKETGKVVTFKSKDTMKAAIKGGSHEPLDKKKVKPGSVFDPEKPADEPSADGANAKKVDDMQADVGKKYGLSAIQLHDNSQDPEEFDSWDEYESHLNDVAKELKDKGYSDPWGDGDDERDEKAIRNALDGAIEGAYDARDRGMDYGDPDVAKMVRDDIEAAINVGATREDFENMVDGMQSASVKNIVKDAMEDFFDDSGTDADSEFGKDYTRKFMGTDEDDLEAKAEESETAIDDAIENKIPQSMEQFDQTKDEIFNDIINLIGDEDEYADIIDNIDSKDPEDYPLSATFNIAHHVVRAAIARGELDRDSDSMEVANFLETYEEDLHDRMMESAKPWKNQYNRLFESLHEI